MLPPEASQANPSLSVDISGAPTSASSGGRNLAMSSNAAPEPSSSEPSEGSEFAELLEQYAERTPLGFTPGELREGRVIEVRDGWVYVDVGLKQEGVLPERELKEVGRLDKVEPGLKVGVTIVGRTEEGYYRLSAVKATRPVDWAGLERAFAEQQVISGTVVEAVKGGFRVDIGVLAFMPASRSGVREPEQMQALIGEQIRCKIVQLDTAREDVVVDRRVVLEEEERAARERLWESLQEGSVVEGTVRSITDYGAFVDLGGVDGLLHVSELSWDRAKKPSDLLREGERIQVKILAIDREKRRISLSLKQLLPDPWSTAAERYPVGARVRGVVTRLAEFGAFVQLEPGVEGLIHLSDLAWSKKIRKPSDVVSPGDAVEVVVLAVDPANRRMSLSLKQALGDPWDEVDTRYPVGSVVEAKVLNVEKFGIFVEVSDGVEGFIHISDVTSERRLRHPNEVVKPGDTVRAMVLEVDRARRRLRLGMKQLEPTPLDRYVAEHRVGDVVSGRVARVEGQVAEVELADGVWGRCRLDSGSTSQPSGDLPTGAADLKSLTALLAAKWKGQLGTSQVSTEVRVGQIRSFRILQLGSQAGAIELQLVA